MVSELFDYLSNNLIIAHYCGFDITRPIPSYWTFDRFLISFDHSLLSDIMKNQVLSLADRGLLDTSFIGLDSTPISANTSVFCIKHVFRGYAFFKRICFAHFHT